MRLVQGGVVWTLDWGQAEHVSFVQESKSKCQNEKCDWLSYHQSVAFYYFAVDKIFCERTAVHTTTTHLGVMAYQPVRLGCKQFAIILKNAFCICLLLSKYFWAPEVPRKMFVSFWCNACSAHFFESWDQDLLQWLVCQRFASDLLATCDTPHTHSEHRQQYTLLY